MYFRATFPMGEKYMKESYRYLFESNPHPMWIYDTETLGFLAVNDAAVAKYGYAREEFLTKTIRDIRPPEDLPRLLRNIADLKPGLDQAGIWRHITRDGRVLSVEIISHTVEYDGRPAELVLARDVTEEWQAGEGVAQKGRELAALNALGRKINASLSLPLVTETAIRMVAELAASDFALLFFREGEVLVLQNVATPESHSHIPVHRVGECLCGLAARSGEALYSSDIHHDRRCTWEECKKAGFRSFAAIPLRSGDETVGVLGLASLTKRDFSIQDSFLETVADQVSAALRNARLYEQVRKQAAELERRVEERTEELAAKNRELETFAYTVSHDLKAPLRGIKGYSHLLLQDHAPQLNEEGRRFLGNIRDAAGQMNRLIDDLLAYSRLERRPLARTRINLRPLVEALVAERGEEIRSRGVEVVMTFACPSVSADRDGLAMVLRNLLDNALKFTRDVPSPRIVIEEEESPEGCRLRVSDNGIGFEMKYHDRIFGIFQRLHRTEDYPGTGVGLAIVRKAVERMGGVVRGESAPGRGASFVLELPTKDEQERRTQWPFLPPRTQ